MWTIREYDELKTLAEVVAESTRTTVFGSTTIDTATQEAVYKYFQYRKVCDNDKFIVFFQRYLYAVEEQYNNMLRVQTIKFDPLVTQYLEHLIENDGSQTSTDSKQSTKQTGNTATNKTTGSDVTSSSASSTDSATTNGETHQSQSNGGSTSHKGNNKAMNAQLPQSSTGSGGFPSSLNWRYATAQNESQDITYDSNSSNSSGSGSSYTTNKGTSSNNGTSTTTHGTTITNTTNGSDNTSESGSNSSTTSSIMKERSTGRSGEAPELLGKAIYYISQTNAFFWLVDKLEPASMQVYE